MLIQTTLLLYEMMELCKLGGLTNSLAIPQFQRMCSIQYQAFVTYAIEHKELGSKAIVIPLFPFLCHLQSFPLAEPMYVPISQQSIFGLLPQTS